MSSETRHFNDVTLIREVTEKNDSATNTGEDFPKSDNIAI